MELPTRRRADTPLPADWIWEKIRKETMTAISALARDMASVRHSPTDAARTPLPLFPLARLFSLFLPLKKA